MPVAVRASVRPTKDIAPFVFESYSDHALDDLADGVEDRARCHALDGVHLGRGGPSASGRAGPQLPSHRLSSGGRHRRHHLRLGGRRSRRDDLPDAASAPDGSNWTASARWRCRTCLPATSSGPSVVRGSHGSPTAPLPSDHDCRRSVPGCRTAERRGGLARVARDDEDAPCSDVRGATSNGHPWRSDSPIEFRPSTTESLDRVTRSHARQRARAQSGPTGPLRGACDGRGNAG